jgi:GT2 family glycosyltransferase
MNNVVAIVVTYNRKELLKECVFKLRNQSCPLDILVIDNASVDGTSELFNELHAGLLYFNTGKNLGGAGGFNYGIKKAMELGYKYLWLLDDDTMPTSYALEMFFKADKFLKGEYGFLTGKVLWKDDSICTMNIQKCTKWRRIKNFDIMQNVQYASFVSLFIKCEVIKAVGLPYKEFFIWADDWEYTRRISKLKKSYYIPDSIVHHWCKSNIGADIVNTDYDRIDRFRYMYRNDVIMYRQDGIEGYFYLTIRNLLHIFKILMKGKDKMKRIKILLESTASGLNFRPKIEHIKGVNQKA